MPEGLEELGRQLRERREKKKLSRREVARRIDRSEQYISLVESARPRDNGRVTQPSYETISDWAEALGTDQETRQRLLQLAGHGPQAPVLDRPAGRVQTSARTYTPATAKPRQSSEGDALDRDANDLHLRLDDLLRRARRSERRWDDTISWIHDAFDYADYRLKQPLRSKSD